MVSGQIPDRREMKNLTTLCRKGSEDRYSLHSLYIDHRVQEKPVRSCRYVLQLDARQNKIQHRYPMIETTCGHT